MLLKGPEGEEEVGQLWDQEEGFPHFSDLAPSYFPSVFLVFLKGCYLGT